MTGPILAIDHASKTFPGQVALDGARLAIYPGEVHALVGQNGSGKSTLIKILAGYIAADRGARVQLAGQTVDLWSLPHDLRRRIHVVHQDLGLVPTLSAIENLALGRGFLTAGAGRIHWRAEAERAQEELLRFGVAPDVRQPMMSLTAAEQAAVAIVRALQDWDDPAGLLILDEPTASLARSEIDALFRAVHEVADGGAGVLFVSHIIDEVLELADRVTVLRDGRVVGEGVPVADLDADRLVEMIAGRDVDELYTPPPEHIGRKVLEAEMVFGIQLRGVSLHVREREVVGVAGLVGSGRDEIAGALFGVTPRFAGRVLVNKTKVFASPRNSIAAGMALVPADRHGLGTIPEQRAYENLTLPRLEPLTSGTTLVRSREMAEVLHWMSAVEVDPPTPTRKMEKFSGGNQQKLVLARWLRMDPKVLLLDEPTQGVDVGAKASVYRLVAETASDGAAVLVASSDAEELVHMCDRVLVLRAGRLVAELAGSDLTESKVVAETLGATGNRGAMRASRHRITTTVVRAGDKRPESPSTSGSDDQPPAEPVPEATETGGLSSRLGQWGRRALRRVRRT